ncbi:MAG: hydroxypyruvate isomerase [Planctomycetaceae bacterium]|nr:MAG: hydroxypyruvate isomerase [Planctomycetaceae bacterium]
MRLDRRSWLGWATTGLACGVGRLQAEERSPAVPFLKGRIRHSLVTWCFQPHFPSFEALCAAASRLGCQSVELCPVEQWPTLKRHGLTCAIASSHGFVRGLNNPQHHEECLSILKQRLEQSAAFGCPNVITFTGMREQIPDDEGAKHCVRALKSLAPLAERLRVTLCLEMLNSRVSDHPMKGHPGYQGDHLEYCVEILKQVGSPYVKLLFDVYHVQIMDGDVIRRLREHADWIGHVHTAGNPGRGELDESQELYYPAIMRALVEVGYQGYVGHEFIPTRPVLSGLEQAIAVCDV